MSHRIYILFATLLSLTLLSCDDTTDTIGTTLTERADHLSVSSSVFEVQSRSVVIDSVVSRNSTGYLGRIKDPETGAYVTGDFMTQFNCLEGFALKEIDSIASRDDQGGVIADSCEVRLFYTSYYGDSLATMKLTLYELDRPMTEDRVYYSDFDPLAAGYVREGGIEQSKSYSLVNTSELSDKSSSKEYINNICVRLNQPYTDRDGATYNNYGTYILRQYYAHPEYFANSGQFTRHILPGFFFKMTGGLGSMAYVSAPQLNIYYRLYVNGADSVSNRLTLFSGTEEVLQTTTVTNDGETIQQLASDNSCTYLKSPSGIFTELTLPVDEIYAGHDNDTVNTAKVVLNRINSSVTSDYVLPMPKTLLLLERDSLNTFFEKGKVANYKQSYLTTYSTSDNSYSFNNIASLVSAMHSAKVAGLHSDPAWVEKHPNWNKVLVVPVTTDYVTVNRTTILTNVSNDMSLTSTRLVGGATRLQMNVIYSSFK